MSDNYYEPDLVDIDEDCTCHHRPQAGICEICETTCKMSLEACKIHDYWGWVQEAKDEIALAKWEERRENGAL